MTEIPWAELITFACLFIGGFGVIGYCLLCKTPSSSHNEYPGRRNRPQLIQTSAEIV